MPEYQDFKSDKNWLSVIDKIKSRYNEYCLKDGKRYYPIPFNSTPEPYQLLIDSFKEELSYLLGKSETEVSGMIPSSSLFAEIFRTNYAPKGEKLHACYLYATGKSKIAFEKDNDVTQFTDTVQPATVVVLQGAFSNRIKIALRLVVLSILICLSLFTYRQNVVIAPNGLILKRPLNGQIVPMKVVIEGSVINGDTIWPIICDVRDTIYHAPAYYVQVPIPVQPGVDTWQGEVYVGGRNKLHIGKKAIIRAFVNPAVTLMAGQRLYTWPQAEFSSAAVHVIRGYYRSDFASGLTVEQPTNHKVVPMKVLIEGKVTNADIVWPIIHALPNGGYYVQAPSQVQKNGKWQGPIYIGGLDQSSAGSRYQVRVFVNPSTALKEGDEIHAWPEADISSAPIEVERELKEGFYH